MVVGDTIQWRRLSISIYIHVMLLNSMDTQKWNKKASL